MKAHSLDTHPDVERAQVELFRRATPERRAQIALSLSQQLMALSRRAIREAHPKATEEEVALMFVAFTYGAGLADRVREYLKSRER
jgi:hypothetical protein